MIVLDNITVEQGVFSLEDVNIHIPEGRYAVLMGGTGSGKTTLLEVICGLRRAETGRVILHGEDVTLARPADRGVGYVPQDGALFKTMKVFDQLAFPLAIRRERTPVIRERIRELAALLSIDHLLDRGAANLSGGERQRVALGRALSFRPGVLLLDEPLTALDEETRERIMQLLKTVQERTKVTTLHVTHNLSEAKRLGDMLLRIDNHQVRHCEMS